MITVVDYGAGNLLSLLNLLDYLGEKCVIAKNPEDILSSSKLIIPGVGSYRSAMDKLNSKHLVDPILEFAKSGKYILGICLGMQVLSLKGFEGGEIKGLGLVNAKVELFSKKAIKIPHVGFNNLIIKNNNNLLYDGLSSSPDFYFSHSFKMVNDDLNDVSSECENGELFTSSVEKENVLGVQFHPELSQYNGVLLMKNFLKV